ncbi:tyrosine-protein phosphatase [Sporomusa acidovorans]|uniref:protein-tyrosine-phosphatase n=1 Tax=Sporomusa acidovorans (strain ATCC 49682 / DSM 3132 / Mol) TaxID=1123286 RepID=A0ABZ3J703_SPOA4|nr:CpsB/CapC family capsule biosynthesis tyrosine phosphatase [Sporomusa acidovorans]OZC19331.1 tyrosine-protein phosphatase YwqE [Sporomusa acidovorans DSM 3132]SDD80518.1 protein-tyrosine phosphatase [Sporomusa acidovorans]
MLDLHCHIIPNIDDGAKNLETSLEMLRIAQQNGTKGIIATPHAIEGEWLPSWKQILEGCELLRQEGAKAGLDIPTYPGAEVAIHQDILNIIQGPGPYCLNGGRYMLVELPAMEIPGFTEDFFFTLQTREITPILAHPERHPILAKNPELLVEWIQRGIMTQINGTSLIGKMGERAKNLAELLLQRDMVHCIGSDAHSAGHRNPDLTAAVKKVVSIAGEKKAKCIIATNPENVINSRDVEMFVVKEGNISKKTNFFKKLLARFIS